jgi:hypothetical protein
MEKTCTVCGQLKSLDSFCLDRRKLTGRAGECKDCHNIRTLKHYHDNREGELIKRRAKDRTSQSPIPPPLEKPCSKCSIIKPNTEFFKDKRQRDGLATHCKSCQRKAISNWGQSHYTYIALRKYGVTPEQYNQAIKDQDNKCAICHREEFSNRTNKLCIDHDHKTGKFRGLLCNRCNRCIGRFDDNPILLRAAAAYLEDRELQPEGLTAEEVDKFLMPDAIS